MSPDSAPRPYTPEDVYGLIRSGFRSTQAGLARAYNTLPYQLDGIAIHENSIRKGRGTEEGVVVFNAQLPPEHLAALRPSSEEKLELPAHSYGVSLTPEQASRKERVKPSLVRFAGRLGLNTSISAGGGYGLTELLDEPLVGSGVGLALFLAARSITRGRYENEQRRQAIADITMIKKQFYDDNQGSIGLLRNRTYVYLLQPYTHPPQPRVQSEAYAEYTDVYESLVHRSTHTTRSTNKDLYGHWDFSKGRLSISPSQLVLTILTHDESPNELWRSGFGDLVKQLSTAEEQFLTAEQNLQAAQDRQSFTDIENPDEIAQCTSAYDQTNIALLKATADIIDLGEKRRAQKAEEARLAATVQLMDNAAGGKFCSRRVQEMASIACRALSRRDLGDEGTLAVAKRLNSYLIGTEERLTDPAQIEQFYRGLLKGFSEDLPHLPQWEDVSETLTTPNEILAVNKDD